MRPTSNTHSPIKQSRLRSRAMRRGKSAYTSKQYRLRLEDRRELQRQAVREVWL